MSKQDINKVKHTSLTEKTATDSRGFIELQAIILNKSKERTTDQKRKIELLAIKFKMEDYINSKDDYSLTVGYFLKSYLKAFHIRQNKFAEYVGLRPSNLTKLINGERSLSHELALVFSGIFGSDPMLWLDIQDKNKLYLLSKSQESRFKNLSLEHLLQK